MEQPPQPARLCRGCLGDLDTAFVYSLDNPKIWDLFAECANLSNTENDPELPQSLCMYCYTKCGQWRVFRTVAQEVDQMLRQTLLEEKEAKLARKKGQGNYKLRVRSMETMMPQTMIDNLPSDEEERNDATLMLDEMISTEEETDQEEIAKTKISNSNIKTKKAYKITLKKFQAWRRDPAVPPTEDEMLDYFKMLKEEMKTSGNTLQTRRSMLRMELKELFPPLDIAEFGRLGQFVLETIANDTPRREPVPILSKEQQLKFLNEAPDDHFLTHKVSMILRNVPSISNIADLRSLTPKDVVYNEERDKIYVHVNGKKREKIENTPECKYMDIMLRYMNYPGMLRKRPRFLATIFKGGKVMLTARGVNSISNEMREVAAYLQLPNPEKYVLKSAWTKKKVKNRGRKSLE